MCKDVSCDMGLKMFMTLSGVLRNVATFCQRKTWARHRNRFGMRRSLQRRGRRRRKCNFCRHLFLSTTIFVDHNFLVLSTSSQIAGNFYILRCQIQIIVLILFFFTILKQIKISELPADIFKKSNLSFSIKILIQIDLMVI